MSSGWTFRRVYQVLERRIELFTCLSFESLDGLSLHASRLAAIGKSRPDRNKGE
jgi:hypothetical protein